MCFLTVLLRLFSVVFPSFLLVVCTFWFLVGISPVARSLVVLFSLYNFNEEACYSGPNMKEAVEMRLPAERADRYVERPTPYTNK